jgi:hypothetical protein
MTKRGRWASATLVAAIAARYAAGRDSREPQRRADIKRQIANAVSKRGQRLHRPELSCPAGRRHLIKRFTPGDEIGEGYPARRLVGEAQEGLDVVLIGAPRAISFACQPECDQGGVAVRLRRHRLRCLLIQRHSCSGAMARISSRKDRKHWATVFGDQICRTSCR